MVIHFNNSINYHSVSSDVTMIRIRTSLVGMNSVELFAIKLELRIVAYIY